MNNGLRRFSQRISTLSHVPLDAINLIDDKLLSRAWLQLLSIAFWIFSYFLDIFLDLYFAYGDILSRYDTEHINQSNETDIIYDRDDYYAFKIFPTKNNVYCRLFYVSIGSLLFAYFIYTGGCIYMVYFNQSPAFEDLRADINTDWKSKSRFWLFAIFGLSPSYFMWKDLKIEWENLKGETIGEKLQSKTLVWLDAYIHTLHLVHTMIEDIPLLILYIYLSIIHYDDFIKDSPMYTPTVISSIFFFLQDYGYWMMAITTSNKSSEEGNKLFMWTATYLLLSLFTFVPLILSFCVLVGKFDLGEEKFQTMVDLNLWKEENLVADSGTLSTFHKLNYKFTETRITRNCNYDNFFLNCKNDKYHSYGNNLNIFTENPFREAYWIITIYMTCCALRYAGAVAAAYWRTKQAYKLYLENMEQDKQWEEELNNIEQNIQELTKLTHRESNKGLSRQSSTPIDPTDNQAHCLSQISEKEAEKYRPKPLEKIKSNLTNIKHKIYHKMSQITDTTTNLKNVSFTGNMTENLSAIKEFGAGLGDDLVKTSENSFKFGWGFARALLVYSAGFLVYQMIPFAGGKKRSLANAALFTLQFTLIFGILMNSAYSHDGIMHELLEISVSKYRDMAKHAGGSVFTAVTLNNTFTNNVVDQMNTFVTDQTDKIPWTSPVGIIPGLCILTAWFLFIVTIMWYNDEHCSQFLENEVDYLSRNPRGAPDYFNDTEYYQQNELKEEMYQKMRLKRQQTQYVKKLDLFDPLAKREKKDADNALQKKRNERKKRIQENQRKLSRRSRASTNTSNSESWIAVKNEETIPIIEKSEISDPIVPSNQETTPEDQLSFLKNERQKLRERYRNSRRRLQEFNNNLGGSIKPRVSRKDFLRRELREGNAQIGSKRVTQSLKNPAVNY